VLELVWHPFRFVVGEWKCLSTLEGKGLTTPTMTIPLSTDTFIFWLCRNTPGSDIMSTFVFYWPPLLGLTTLTYTYIHILIGVGHTN